jgi:ribosomal protein L11 methyltransferase
LSANLVELRLVVPQHLVEPVSDALMDELDALSVSIEDADAGSSAENALFGEPGMPAPAAGWQRSWVKALFPTETPATLAVTQLLAQDWAAGVQLESMQTVPEQDWVRLTQSQFIPVEITPSFWVVPSWHEAPAGAQKIIHLDPGLAFGTGTHPTTRMCLRWIAQHATPWPRVLDYGCGSGILAMGAALHGAMHIDAVDIDPTAVQQAQTNAQANQLGQAIQTGLPDIAHGHYPLVLANILASPLKLLAPLLCKHTSPKGRLVLAGILERQADELKAAYAPWCSLEVSDQEEGWILMTALFKNTL